MLKLDMTPFKKKLEEYAKKYPDKMQVQVGLIPDAVTADSPRTDRTIPEIATYAMFNEYGTKNIPARPFFRTAIKRKGKEWQEYLGKALAKTKVPEEAFKLTGTLAREDIRASIEQTFGSWEPNTPETRARKTRISKEEGGTVGTNTPDPLIWTGAMHRSIGYKVVVRGQE